MTKQELKQYRYLVSNINQLQKYIERTEKNGLNAERQIKEYEKALKKSMREREKIEKAVNALPPREQMVMRFRYIDGLKWDDICIKTAYEWAQVHRIHAKALDMICK